ncbi:hypothetical protein FQN54_002267 [Arachnomyces sp. PD_36]|nr:hypothetical protein FQN54_002267 [Arachnomyces sp. PD_36]
MVSLSTVRSHNAGLKELGPGLVAVFVGGTSGIGETTAKEFVRNTVEPRVYIVGRNEEQASRILEELKKINPSGTNTFIKSDVSLLRNVDIACEEIKAQEGQVNLLCLSPGYLSLESRTETPEGLDKKLNLNYYSRLRFVHQLLPQLNQASAAGRLSSVLSVLGAGNEGKMYLDDMSLKKNYNIVNCLRHATMMNSFAAEELAKAHPGTKFIHAYPGVVKTNIAQGFGAIMRPVMRAVMALSTPFTVDIKESGERHLYAATSNVYPPSAKAGGDAVSGIDGAKGSGAYRLNWDGSVVGKDSLLKEYRSQGVGKKIWDHTLEVFEKVCGKDGGKW